DILAAANDDIFQAVANLDVTVGMNYGGIAGMKPTFAHGLRGGRRVLVVTSHYHVTAHDNFPNGLAVARDLLALIVVDSRLSGSDQLDALPRLDDCAFAVRKLFVLGAQLANGDEWSSLGQSINLRDLPAKFPFQPFDGRGCRRRTGRHYAQTTANISAQL